MNSLARVALLCTQLNYLSIVLARPTWFVPWVPLGKGPFTLATRSDPQSPKPVTTAAGAARDAATQGDAANQPRQQQLQQPLELTPQYNAFPWIFTTQRLYIIPMVPPAQAPTPAPAHADYTESLNGFIGLQSTIALITYSDSVIGRYDELLYSAGLYTDPATCSKKALASIDRIWVDSKLSQRAGRNIWGIPKEIAVFEWDSEPGLESVTVKDPQTGDIILQATFSDIPLLPGYLLNTAAQFSQVIMPTGTSGVQWPIVDNITDADAQVDPATVPAYQESRAAYSSQPRRLVQSTLGYSITGAQVKKVLTFSASSEALLGRPSVNLKPLVPLSIKLPVGAKSTISAPKVVNC